MPLDITAVSFIIPQNGRNYYVNLYKYQYVSTLAETAGVSTDTYSKGKKILDSNNEELKKRVQSGETSISAGYKELTQCKKVLKDLIETNIRQRGIGNPNPIKLGRCIKELERIYGIQHGSTSFQGNQYNEVSPKVSDLPNTEIKEYLDLLKELWGI